MIGKTNATDSRLDAKSWRNYIAVRKRTKTTIESGDIDVSTITGQYSAAYMFYATALTSVNLNFASMTGASGCMTGMFQLCTSLVTVRLSLPVFTSAISVQSIFTSDNSINYLILDAISDNAVWSVTSANNNILTQTQLSTCQNLTINCDILPNLYLAVMTSLNFASVVQVLGQLHNYAGGTAHTITFNRAFTGLSQADYDTINAAKTTANNRNWTVSGLTYSL